MEWIKKHFTLIARILISATILLFIANKLEWIELWQIIQGMRWGWLVLSFFIFGIVFGISILRWKILLGVHGIPISMYQTTEISMVGVFFNSFLLGTVGGDVAKIYYSAKAYPEKRSAISLSILFDRAIGLFVLLVFAGILGFFQYEVFFEKPTTKAALIAVWGFGGVTLVGLLFFLKPSLWKLGFRAANRFVSERIQRTLQNIHEAFERHTNSHKENILALLLSFFVHGGVFLSSVCLLKAMRIENINMWQLGSTLTIIWFLIAIPISISGFGWREYLYIIFFQTMGINSEYAVTFSLVGFALVLGWSLVGGIFYFKHRRPNENFLKEKTTE